MAQCCDNFKMVEDQSDSFQSWQGLRGPYYTPVLDSDGNLSWTNNGGLPNPPTVNISGAPGAGLDIKGVVATPAELPATAAQGDVWLVGTTTPYTAYVYNAGAWISIGPILQPNDIDDALSLTSTNPVQNKVVTQALLDQDWVYTSLLAGGADYHTVKKAFFKANGAAAVIDFSYLCSRWYTLTRLGWSGGVRFQRPQEGVTTPSDGTKTGDNAGLVCVPSTTTEANQDDYANNPLFAVTDCNVELDADGVPHITAIDGIAGNFERDNPAKIVAVLQMTGLVRYYEDASVYGFDYTDVIGADGFYPLPEAVELKDNSVRSWVVHGKYGFGDGYTCCSGQKTLVWSVSHNSQLTGVRSAWGNRYCGFTSADDAFLKLMLYLKYGRLDSDSVLHGCCNYNYTYQLAAAETGVERVLLTPAQAANLLVGSCICVGIGTARSSKANDTALLDRVLITKIETVEVDGVSYGAVYVDNSGVTFDTSTTYYLYTYQWHTGATDAVLGNDGGINPANDRYPVKIQGVEVMVGCYEASGDTILRYEESGGVQCQVAHVCRDASKLTTSITADYKTCPYGMQCPASSSWAYPKRMGHDETLPEIMLGIIPGGSSSVGPRAGYYIEAYTANTVREWLRWGCLDNGLGRAGLSCCNGVGGLGGARWYVGGRLSVTGNRGEYQASA